MNDILSLEGGTFFLQNIGDVYIAESEAAVCVSVNDETIFDERIFAEADGRVYLRGLPELLQPYACPGNNDVQVSMQDLTASFRVVYSDAYVTGHESGDALLYLENHFMSNAVEKRSSMDSFERLAAYGNPSNLKYECLFVNSNGLKYIESGILSGDVVERGNGFCVYNVSPSKFAKEVDTLLGYFIQLGCRKMRYLIDPTISDRSLHFSFVNEFGIVEDLTIPGVVNSPRSVDRIEAVLNGSAMTINPRLRITHKVQTGVLTEAEVALLSALVASRQIWYVDNGLYVPVVLADSPRIEPTSNATSYATAQFSFRYAKNDLRIGNNAIDTRRRFDGSFDSTFPVYPRSGRIFDHTFEICFE